MTDAFRLRISQYMKVVGLTILGYDYIVTMDKEVRLMWGSKWGVARVLFCISRYLPFIASAIYHYYAFAHLPNLSDYDKCFPLYDAVSWLNVFAICASEGLLILRTYAMWNCNRYVLYGLMVFVSALLTAAFVLEVKAGDTLSYGPPPFSGVPGCYPTNPADVLYMFCMMLVIFESAILLLVLIQVIKHSRRICGVATGLLTSLYRDSLLFVVCLLCMSIVNLVVMSTIPPRFNEVFDTLPAIMHSVLASRIMFNIRQSAHCDVITMPGDIEMAEMESSSPVVLRFSVFGRV
ncbi:hypothetical protein K503DRAFT_772919 [Rhizopogon vinicolor AM-OR11-026]|uniref:DUF6533 domain-containing protein n=1 Tax=Rhizopogon vinicolor AM-OR11-026 TaxID=1314800 RepID=A0A1B7MTS3_9AGAM|nr:hypothetical protein K503DRAFT_772919 [Rhizopogon vinicolor AM-OR11-026]